eukprot:gnl/TRDRNA2_/TRDRNA2_130181_c2_seq1.p1 gnl/TRDRNA2_/TRDRNA2_130181_c2~~gnl/TRDRNA2_/TRDRNA2_130181_c2_seq1.p1  ORF type:complete len:176 (+),score=25.31 gnl/TRDRNA2_/TRDRNA2_130181_c2_seq1:32-529(+)
MRGGDDQIAGLAELRSWKQVAGGKWQHREFKNSGHMLAIEAPASLANYILFASLLDLSDEVSEFSDFRNQYRLLRQALRGTAKPITDGRTKPIIGMKTLMVAPSPILGPQKIPMNLPEEDYEMTLEVLKESQILTPQTTKVKQMRSGNIKWRQGQSQGNPLPQVH